MVNLFRSASIDPRVSFRCVFIRWRRLASALYFLSATGAHVAQRRGRRPRPSTVAIKPLAIDAVHVDGGGSFGQGCGSCQGLDGLPVFGDLSLRQGLVGLILLVDLSLRQGLVGILSRARVHCYTRRELE